MSTTDPLTAKGAQTRDAILRAAISRFARDGYRSTSVADIAREARVSGTLTSAYFPTQEALSPPSPPDCAPVRRPPPGHPPHAPLWA